MLPDLLFELDVQSQPLKRMPDARKRSPVVLLSSSHAYTLSGIGFRVNSQELAIRHGIHGREGKYHGSRKVEQSNIFRASLRANRGMSKLKRALKCRRMLY